MDCGPTCLRMVARYYGKAYDLQTLRTRSHISREGVSLLGISDAAESIGFRTMGVQIPFEKLAEEADRAKTPFFHVLLTLSSHTPFDVPMEPVFPGTDHLSKFHNSVYYTDQALGKFLETARTRDWWDETLIILMAGHGCRIGNTTAHAKERFSIPMLWLGGALSVRDTVISKIGSQTDLPATLLNQLGLAHEDFKFSKDLFSGDTKSFTYYTYNDGIGFLTDTSYTVFSLVTNDYLVKQDSGLAGTNDAGLAYLQFLFDDFNSK